MASAKNGVTDAHQFTTSFLDLYARFTIFEMAST
jgi:hypothetical protein